MALAAQTKEKVLIMTSGNNLQGKVAFVTGAGTGLGKATAAAFARAGANVVVVGRKLEALEETVRHIESEGGKALAIPCDVANEISVKQALEQTIKVFGRLDFAFNNAGIEQEKSPTVEISSEIWNEMVATNLTGVFNCMKHQIPLIDAQGGGAIVNTSSGAGVKGFPGQAAYCATKFGVIGLTKATALDYAASGIRVNAVCPGIIDTPMMGRFTGGTQEGREAAISQEPVGRAGHPEEIAGTVMWLCSDLGAFTTGAVIVVDGGQTV